MQILRRERLIELHRQTNCIKNVKHKRVCASLYDVSVSSRTGTTVSGKWKHVPSLRPHCHNSWQHGAVWISAVWMLILHEVYLSAMYCGGFKTMFVPKVRRMCNYSLFFLILLLSIWRESMYLVSLVAVTQRNVSYACVMAVLTILLNSGDHAEVEVQIAVYIFSLI